MKKKRNKSYRPKLIHIPMSAKLRDDIAMQMHMSLAALRTEPDLNSFECLSGLFNTITLATLDDDRFREERLQLRSGAAMLEQIGHKVTSAIKLRDHEVACLTAAVGVMDDMLPRIGVEKLHVAMVQLRELSE